ncbi:MAG: hypothetical protein ACJAZ0_001452 [Halioglobus sp.]|jgi:hypothetical protein
MTHWAPLEASPLPVLPPLIRMDGGARVFCRLEIM